MEQFVPLIVLMVVGYAMVIRPQQKKQKDERTLMASLRAGDEIMTVGGLYGVIIEAPEGEQFIWLDVAESVELKVSRTAVKTIVSREGEDAAEDAAEDADDDVDLTNDDRTPDDRITDDRTPDDVVDESLES